MVLEPLRIVKLTRDRGGGQGQIPILGMGEPARAAGTSSGIRGGENTRRPVKENPEREPHRG